MLAEAVIGTLGGAAMFSLVSPIKGAVGTALRFAATLAVGVSALVSAGLLFGHPGWNIPDPANYNARASMFLLLLMVGPAVLGFLFLMLGLLSLGVARSEWHNLRGTQPGPNERVLYRWVGFLFTPRDLVKAVFTRTRAALAATVNSQAGAEAARTVALAEALVNKYGEVLETVEGLGVADVSSLPASKKAMKAALLLGIKLTADRQQREYLKAGYVQLSMFQASVGRYRDEDLVKASLTEGHELLQDLKARGL